jgi:multiple sugar transport system substrate-binding protein
MKKLQSILCALTLVLTMLIGCDDTSSPVPTPSGDGSVSGAEPSPDVPEWAPPPIYYGTLEIDPTQTGELNIFSPFNGWSLDLSPVIDLYRTIYPNVDLIVRDTPNMLAYGTLLSAELMAGTGPDILFPRYMGRADLYKLADAGAFLDLNDLIEQDDSFNLDDYIKPVMDGGIYRGKRYLMPYSYTVSSFISIPSKLDEIGFDMSTSSNSVSFLNEVVRALPKAQENPSFNVMFNANLLVSLILTFGVDFVDNETNKVFPDEELFENLMKAYKPYSSYDTLSFVDDDNRAAAYLHNGAIAFNLVNDIRDFIVKAGIVKKTSDYQINIIPDINGLAHTFPTMTVAIQSGSPNQQNAWNFIKLMLSQENQSRSLFQGIPVHRDSISTLADRIYDDFSGTGHIANLTKEEIDAFLSLITNVGASASYLSFHYWYIVDSDMYAFFNDEISYDDFIFRAKNDLNLYLSE